MTKAHKIELKPTKEQEAYFRQACGVSRFCWNWGLAEWEKQYKEDKKPSGFSLKKQFNSIYKEQFPWVKEVLRDAHSQPFATLQDAMQRFFKKKAQHPVFKKKGKSKDSFYVANDKFSLDGCSAKLPKIGNVKMTEELRFQGKVNYAVVSRDADRWYISISVDLAEFQSQHGDADIGIDLGIKTSVVCSDGEIFQSSRPMKKRQRRLSQLQRMVARRMKGSSNRRKAIKLLSKQHWKVKNIRKDFLHKTTTSIIRKSQAVCIEDLSVGNMLKNHCLAKAISEQGFHEFRRQLTYKAMDNGVVFVVADRFFASSKKCSFCGSVKKELKLSERMYKCEQCGAELDRDLNAAINLKKQIPTASREYKPVDRPKGGLKQELPGVYLYTLER
jgi:putative transposase